VDRGQENFTEGLDLVGGSGVNLQALTLGPGWTGNIEGAPLLLECNGSGRRVRVGSGSRRVNLSSTSRSKVITKLEVDLTRGAGGVVEVGTVTVASLIAAAGQVRVLDSAEVTDVRVDGGTVMVMRTGVAGAVTGIVVNAGACVVARDVGTVTVRGGGVVQIDDPSVSPGTVNVDGGRLEVGTHGGTIGTLNVTAGVVDLSGVSGPLTITTANLGSAGACTVLMPRDASLVTITTANLLGAGDPRRAA
jgi:hypothetical protein